MKLRTIAHRVEACQLEQFYRADAKRLGLTWREYQLATMGLAFTLRLRNLEQVKLILGQFDALALKSQADSEHKCTKAA